MGRFSGTFGFLVCVCVLALGGTPAAAQDAAASATSATTAPAPETAPVPTPAPSAMDTMALDAEVSAALSSTDIDSAGSSGPSLRIYGFTDFTFAATLSNDLEYYEALYGKTSFSVGNVNIYLDGDLGEGFRSLVEVRFLYLPNGSLDGVAGKRQTTAAFDYTDSSRPMRWGGISIERAVLEYSAWSWLNVRAGQWLTPVGIWNADHATPTIIPATRPYVVGEGLIPLRQTGLEVYGSELFGETTLGYSLTLSNGRGNLDDYQDLDTNKALGARLYTTIRPLGALTLGLTGYLGRTTRADVAVDTSSSTLGLKQAIDDQHDELSYGGDLLWVYEGLHVQGEVLANERAYTDAGRPAPQVPIPGGGKVPDHRRYGMYGLVGYRLPWLTLMPYAMLQYFDSGMVGISAPGGISSGTVFVLTGGLNLRPTASVALKAELSSATLKDLAGSPGTSRILSTNFSAAWSF